MDGGTRQAIHRSRAVASPPRPTAHRPPHAFPKAEKTKILAAEQANRTARPAADQERAVGSQGNISKSGEDLRLMASVVECVLRGGYRGFRALSSSPARASARTRPIVTPTHVPALPPPRASASSADTGVEGGGSEGERGGGEGEPDGGGGCSFGGGGGGDGNTGGVDGGSTRHVARSVLGS